MQREMRLPGILVPVWDWCLLLAQMLKNLNMLFHKINIH